MTVSNTNNKVAYQGNGSTTTFPITFPYAHPADLQVWTLDPSGNLTQLTSAYLVDTVNNQIDYPGYIGNPPYNAPPPLPTGWYLFIVRSTALTQLLDITNQGTFYASDIESALDQLTYMMQDQASVISRIPQLPISTNTSYVLPTPAASSIIGWDSTGTKMMNYQALPQGGWSVTDISNAVNLAKSGGTIPSNVSITGTLTAGATNAGNTAINGTFTTTGNATIGGTLTMGAALAMGSNKITGLVAGSASTDAVNVSQIIPHGKQLFTSSGIFTVPTNVTQVWISLAGGGGGGGSNGGNGGTGGTSSFGSYVFCAGGGGGSLNNGGSAGGSGGASGQSGSGNMGGIGGGSMFGAGGGGEFWVSGGQSPANGGGYGGGGGGGDGSNGYSYGGGGGADAKIAYNVTGLTSGANIAVTVGGGGAGGPSGSGYSGGGNGASGFVLVEW